MHKPHPSNPDDELEFRFSFSLTEDILFKKRSTEQKQCLVAFKALVMYVVHKLESVPDCKTNLKTYHLKTIFMWACETLPADDWQTAIGWSQCLLYMIDQLHECLSKNSLPSYFLQDCDLFNGVDISSLLLPKIAELRKSPLVHAAGFLDSTEWFDMSYSKISEALAVLENQNYENATAKNILERRLLFLQTIIGKTELTRKVSFWRKRNMLRFFWRWCEKNSFKINLQPWECLTDKKSLFDVVYLDVEFDFNVPNEQLLEHVDREWSVELIHKLAACYSNEALHLNSTVTQNKERYTLHLKTLLMMQHALENKFASVETIVICLSFLVIIKKYDIVIRVLESAEEELLGCEENIFYYTNYINVFGYETTLEILEIFDITHMQDICIPMSVFLLFLRALCYNLTQDEGKIQNALEQLNDICGDDGK